MVVSERGSRSDSAQGARGAGARPLEAYVPQLAGKVCFAALGEFPTTVESLSAGHRATDVFVKRDDLSSLVYGGNKVRTLEVLLGQALQRGCTRVVSTGAFGSNHALATALHAVRLGLEPAALLFPQPHSEAALDNFEATVCHTSCFVPLPHWSLLPWGIWRWGLRDGPRTSIMPPGGANPWGGLGYVSAALELAEQVAAGQLPAPARIVLPVGSTCTCAGLLVGLRLARRLGLAFRERLPIVHAVRVTPWPVTSVWRIVRLAHGIARLLEELAAAQLLEVSRQELARGLFVDPRFLGTGYGQATKAGRAAMQALEPARLGLDTVYGGKAAAGLLQVVADAPGPTLFWATKSSVPMPRVEVEPLTRLSGFTRRWWSEGRQRFSVESRVR